MIEAAKMRGARPVANIADMNPLEAISVHYFRLWFDGREGQERVMSEFRVVFGDTLGESYARSMQDLLLGIVQHSRRPLMHHHVRCECVGADECAFANIMAAAAAGEHEDATLFASLLMRPDMAICMASIVQDVGIILGQMIEHRGYQQPNSIPQNTRLH